jgi:site-specific recombinase XerD
MFSHSGLPHIPRRDETALCAVLSPDLVDAFLDHLATERKLSASSVNHHRTIVNGIFNFAVKRGRFDKNPGAAVRQRPEPPGRDRIVSPAEFRTLGQGRG